jgi:hypothetical protein
MSDYIGIRNVTTGTPLSGHWIDDLEGMNLSLGSALANESNITGVKFLQDKIRIGSNLVDNDIFTYMLKLFRVNDVLGSGIVGKLTGNTFNPLTYNAVSPDDRGIRIKRINTPMAKIMLKSVDIHVQNALSTNLVVLDGDETYTYPVTLLANTPNKVDIYQQFESQYIYITLDNTALITANLPINRTYFDNTADDCECINFNCAPYKYFTCAGWNGSSIESNTFGIVANVQVICDRKELIKTIDHLLGRPKLLRSGIEILKELINSNRLNEYTILNSEQAVLTITNWQTEYNTLMNALRECLPSYYSDFDRVCVTCNSTHYSNKI